MGVVYRATHVHLGREVALKLLAPQFSGNDEFRARFLRESRLAASLDHPNVITVYDAGDFNGTLYIAMRCVEGIDLAQLLREEGPLEPLRAISLLDQVAAALDAAHEHGLVHRDVKPANVMIASGRCYLTDFGLTKQAAATTASLALTRTGSFLGTLHYAAPEQIEGREVTAQTDVYALGCVLHESLTGAPPFVKDSEVALLYAHLSEPPPPPSELRPDLPGAIDDVVAKALAKSPDGRYRTCAELMSAARAALTQEGGPTVAARPAPPTVASAAPTVPAEPPTVAAEPTAPRAPKQADTRGLPAEVAPGARAGEPRRPGSRRRVILLAVGAAIVAAAVVGVVVANGGGAGKHNPQSTSGGQLPSDAILVGNSPDGFANDKATSGDQNAGTTWTANAGDGTVTAIDMKSKRAKLLARYTSGSPNSAAPLVYWHQALWVGDSQGVQELDASTGAKIGAPINVSGQPYSMSVAPNNKSGDLWVTNYNDTIVRISPGAGSSPPTVAQTITGLGSGAKRMAQHKTVLWVANPDTGTVTTLDASTGTIRGKINVGGDPVAINFSNGELWVVDHSRDWVTRWRVDPVSPARLTRVSGVIRVGRGPKRLSSGGGAVWVANSLDGTVTKINGRTGQPSNITVGGHPDAITMANQFVLVALWSQPTIPEHAPFPHGGVVQLP
jgi:serine/threonine-protein kinase